MAGPQRAPGAVAAGSYDLFFCGSDPVGEPSCEPFRSGEFDGQPITGDMDGDGVADTSDNCPTVFNPGTPLFGGLQGDGDGDNIGDACDACPNDSTDTCAKPADVNDLDGDGALNLDDLCPLVNDNQTDTDGDGAGDACDACPTSYNPAGGPCPSTVQSIQDITDPNHPAPGSAVALAGLTVTAVGSSGFFAQDAGATSPDYSGVYIYTNSAPTVSRGDIVSVSGTYDEYFDLTEITGPVVTVTGTGPVPAPTVVTAAEVKTGGTRAEALEGVLIEVQGVTLNHINPDLTADYMEFEVGGTSAVVDTGLRVDDFLYDYNTRANATDADYRVLGKTFTSITGPLSYSFGNHKLMPRDAADMVSP